MSASETTRPRDVQSEIPLSANQEFLCMFDKGPEHGALGPRHLVVFAWRVTGQVDTEVLRAALSDVVARHEILRTSIMRDEGAEQQIIHPPSEPRLVVRELPDDSRPRDLRAEEFVNEIEGGRFSIHEQPLLMAALGRFDDQDAVLVLLAHHIASDGWSMHVIISDLAACYAIRRGHVVPALPEASQYRRYAEWQRANLTDELTAPDRRFWREKLNGATVLAVPTDRPVTEEVCVYSVHRYLIDQELTSGTLALSRAMHSSPFMILFTVFNVLLYRMTGVRDVVVPTITSGRAEPQFTETVGALFNFVPLRTDLAGCRNFRDAVHRVRDTCFEAYAHELPFLLVARESPDLFSPLAAGDRAVFAFQVFQFPAVFDGELVGDLRYTELRKRLLSEPDTSDIPDGALWTLDLDPSGVMAGSLRFDRNVFDAETITDMINEFERLLRRAVTDPGIPLEHL